MRKPLLCAGTSLFLILNFSANAQTNVIWRRSFSPAWTSGNTSATAFNVGGTGINCTASATIYGSGNFERALGTYGGQTPTVSEATFYVPGSVSRLQLTPDFETISDYTEITIAFTSLVNNVNFKIADIDKSEIGSEPYFDRVTITGSDGAGLRYPVLTKYDAVSDPAFLQINGNVAQVNTEPGQAGNCVSDLTDQRGTINVDFGSTAIRTITIRYDNAPGPDLSARPPAPQSIAVGDIQFTLVTLADNFLQFSGRRSGNDIALNWTVTDATAIRYEIERNTGGSWQQAGSVSSSGNSVSQDYSFIDRNINGNLILYRLKQLHANGSYRYSGIVRISGQGELSILSYPNPATEAVNLNVNSPARQPVNIFVYEVNGKLALTEARYLNTGNNNIVLHDLTKLSGGMYYVEIKNEYGISLGRTAFVRK